MKLWIARDKAMGTIHAFSGKPRKDSTNNFWRGDVAAFIRDDIFPEITWENSPQLVEIREPLPEPSNLLLEYPLVEIRLSEGQLYELIGIIRQGRLDMARRLKKAKDMDKEAKRIYFELYNEQLDYLYSHYNELRRKYYGVEPQNNNIKSM